MGGQRARRVASSLRTRAAFLSVRSQGEVLVSGVGTNTCRCPSELRELGFPLNASRRELRIGCGMCVFASWRRLNCGVDGGRIRHYDIGHVVVGILGPEAKAGVDTSLSTVHCQHCSSVHLSISCLRYTLEKKERALSELVLSKSVISLMKQGVHLVAARCAARTMRSAPGGCSRSKSRLEGGIVIVGSK